MPSSKRPARGLAAFMASAGATHFIVPGQYDAIVPSRLPGDARLWTYLSGAAELACAAAVAVPKTRRAGALATAALFLAVFPANVKMAYDWRRRPLPQRATAYGRLPLQVPLVIWALKVASYETILDECVIHRLGVPPAVMAVQLRHMINAVSSENKIAVRLLPHDAHIPGGTLPQSTFHHFTFPDPGDHPLVVLEAITTDVVLTQRRDVARYTSLHDRLRAASLPRDESLSFLNRVAERLTERAGSGP